MVEAASSSFLTRRGAIIAAIELTRGRVGSIESTSAR
jgi:hypothetical protein